MIRKGKPGGQQPADGANDTTFRQVAPWIVVLAHDEDARMMTAEGLRKVLEVLEIVVIVGEQDAVFENGMGEVHRVVFAGHAHLDGSLHIMACLPQ
jgi:hypothetical protein